MMQDLFVQTRTKKEDLKDFILSRAWTSTADVDKWGLENRHIRARRDAQDMAQEGFFRRMTEEERARHIIKSTLMGYWVRNDFQ